MRSATLRRTTTETDIRLRVNLDGRGKARISTGIRFLDLRVIPSIVPDPEEGRCVIGLCQVIPRVVGLQGIDHIG